MAVAQGVLQTDRNNLGGNNRKKKSAWQEFLEKVEGVIL